MVNERSSVSVSLLVVAAYAFVIGLLLFVVPSFVFFVFGFGQVLDAWPRVAGALAVAISLLYAYCGWSDSRTFARASILGRSVVALALLGLVIVGLLRWTALLFTLLDGGTAVWTYVALRNMPRG